MSTNKIGDYKDIKLSVFFPAYNEQANIRQTVEKALSVLKKLNLANFEIIVINDGSRDKTLNIAQEIEKNEKNVRVINQPNGGYGMALRAGFGNSSYDWIVYTDSDGQFDFTEITKFLDRAGSADVVWGYRIKRQDPLFRLLFAKGWSLVILMFFGFKLKDIDCGFKLFKKEVIRQISPLISTRGGMINAELAVRSKKNKFTIAQVGVNHYPRTAGQPTGANIRVIIQSFIDLFKLWWKLSF